MVGPDAKVTPACTCFLAEQGGSGLGMASLRTLLCGHSRQQGCAPWFARRAERSALRHGSVAL